MNLFFILGREPALSAAEIIAAFRRLLGEEITTHVQNHLSMSREVLIASVPETLDPQMLMRELGGTVKLGRILTTWDTHPEPRVLEEAVAGAVTHATQAAPRVTFGFSAYDAHPDGTPPRELRAYQRKLRDLGIAVKRTFGKDRKVRFVTSRESTLSSVVVETNKLVGEGVEIVFLLDGTRLHLGHTIAVQPWKEFGTRDYGRPERDPVSGMLPPKLARALVNLAALPATKTLLDPFCGSGTILTEAWLLGYRSLIASDIDSTAIARTKSNLEWVDAQAAHTVRLIDSGVKQLPNILTPASVDAIVTEPYLGPPLRGRETRETIEEIERQLLPLFHDMLTSFRTLLRPRGVVVIAFPLWVLKNEVVHASILQRIKEYGFVVKQPLPSEFITPALAPEFGTNGKTLIYGRPDQRVWREIAILEKVSP